MLLKCSSITIRNESMLLCENWEWPVRHRAEKAVSTQLNSAYDQKQRWQCSNFEVIQLSAQIDNILLELLPHFWTHEEKSVSIRKSIFKSKNSSKYKR